MKCSRYRFSHFHLDDVVVVVGRWIWGSNGRLWLVDASLYCWLKAEPEVIQKKMISHWISRKAIGSAQFYYRCSVTFSAKKVTIIHLFRPAQENGNRSHNSSLLVRADIRDHKQTQTHKIECNLLLFGLVNKQIGFSRAFVDIGLGFFALSGDRLLVVQQLWILFSFVRRVHGKN